MQVENRMLKTAQQQHSLPNSLSSKSNKAGEDGSSNEVFALKLMALKETLVKMKPIVQQIEQSRNGSPDQCMSKSWHAESSKQHFQFVFWFYFLN